MAFSSPPVSAACPCAISASIRTAVSPSAYLPRGRRSPGFPISLFLNFPRFPTNSSSAFFARSPAPSAKRPSFARSPRCGWAICSAGNGWCKKPSFSALRFAGPATRPPPRRPRSTPSLAHCATWALPRGARSRRVPICSSSKVRCPASPVPMSLTSASSGSPTARVTFCCSARISVPKSTRRAAVPPPKSIARSSSTSTKRMRNFSLRSSTSNSSPR